MAAAAAAAQLSLLAAHHYQLLLHRMTAPGKNGAEDGATGAERVTSKTEVLQTPSAIEVNSSQK